MSTTPPKPVRISAQDAREVGGLLASHEAEDIEAVRRVAVALLALARGAGPITLIEETVS
jgi:hypothetical protein